jgi:serine/threonine-protein kinase
VPPELEQVVLRAMEKQPANRFQTMDDFYHSLGDPTFFGALPSVRASAQMATVMSNSGIRGPSAVRPVTTLSGAASEVSQPMPRVDAPGGGSKAGIFAAAGLVVVGGIGGAAYFLRGGSAPPPAAVQPAASAPAKRIKISFVTSPAGARVTRPDGTVLGNTPLKMEVERDSGDFDVAFQLDGYTAARRRIIPDDGKELNISLMAQPAAEAPAAPAKAVSSRSSSSSSSSSRRSSKPARSEGGGVDDARLLRSSLLDDPAPKHK